jgi:hypothetical protein
MSEELFDKGLPKWPALIVVGKPVTEQQAMVINVMTDRFSFCSNDREFEKQIHEVIYGVAASWSDLTDELEKKYNTKGFNETWDLKDKMISKYGPLDLTYLSNSRIVSSWIGGPHGWCNWDGTIGSSNYNIGKYPSVRDVYEDCVKIAEAFPFLEMKIQLMNQEASEDDKPLEAVVEYSIKDGIVEMYEPTEILKTPHFGSDSMYERFNNPHAERGCTIEKLKESLKVSELYSSVNERLSKDEFWNNINS